MFGQDTIIPINHIADWNLILQHKHVQINYDADRENESKVEHNYQVGNKEILRNNQANE